MKVTKYSKIEIYKIYSEKKGLISGNIFAIFLPTNATPLNQLWSRVLQGTEMSIQKEFPEGLI